MLRARNRKNVDFVVDSRPLTKKEELAISEFIKADKEKRKSLGQKTTKKQTSIRSKTTA